MDSHWGTPNHRKRKRRRGPEKPPIPAHLTLDSRLKGDFGYLSEDLFLELFPSYASAEGTANEELESTILYAAIKPHLQSSLLSLDSIPWTILPVKKSTSTASAKQENRSTLRFSSSSTALHAFVGAMQKISPNRPPAGFQSGVDILIIDVAPLQLDTIVVSVDDVALRNLENANNDFHQSSGPKRRGSRSNIEPHFTTQKERQANVVPADSTKQGPAHWEDAVRKALSQPKLVHAGDVLPLPLASHPITHVSPPPALVEMCQPVAQGFISPSTRVVVLAAAKTAKRTAPVARSSYVIPNGVAEEEEDTSNEQFYSAAEDKSDSPAPKVVSTSSSVGSGTDSEEPDASNDEDTDLSDGEGDTIGLDLPMLPTQSSGIFSAFSSATPRPGQFAGNGIATPGSVVSTFSTSTIRGGGSKGRLFETHGLLAPIPDEALHPKAPADEDEEARVYMDTTSLVKIGCFSGDWVRIEVAADNPFGGLRSLGMDAFESRDTPQEWRTAKVYALPGQAVSRPRYAIDRGGHRRSSIISMSRYEKPSMKAYMSPLFLSNLGNPSNVHIASLAPPQQHRGSLRGPLVKNKITGSNLPPVAKDVTFMRLLTPVATEKSMDSSFHLGVRKFFESKQRIVKSGDLIGIAIDTELGQAVYQGAVTEEEQSYEELLSRMGTGSDGAQNFAKTAVVWFKIGSVVPEAPQENADQDEEPSWGGVAVVKPGITRMAQSGSEQGKIPDAIHNQWAYYLGAKHLPISSDPSLPPVQLMAAPKSFISQAKRRLRELISAATSPQAVHFGLPPVAILLASTQRQVGKAKAATSACLDLGLHTFSIDSFDIINDAGGGGGDVKTAGLLEARAERAMSCGPQYTALLIRHVDVLTADRMAPTLKQILSNTRVFIATTTDVENVPEDIRSLFTHEIEVGAPDEGEREGLLRDIVQDKGISLSADVDLSFVALKTAALVAGDLEDVVARAAVAREERLERLASLTNKETASDQSKVTIRDIQIAGGEASRCVTKSDFDVAVEAARKNFADAIGAPKIPNVSWDDVGGLTNVKEAVMETIQLPLERPELFAKGMKKRSGILFYGPPGTGKTLLAKAIATEFSLNFFSVKGPELLNMYIGESEANVRRVFQRARDARPCVVFFDELDSVAPKRGNQGDSGGVMDRIVSQLLAELDGMSNGEDGGGGVFVIGATNRPDLLDQALLRPGRFDKMLYLGVSDTHEKQLTILEALIRKFALHPSLSLTSVAESLPFTYTGADLYALCSDAMLKAITRRATSVDVKVRSVNDRRAASLPPQEPISVAHFFDHYASPEDTEVVVEEADFMSAIAELVPSVSVRELEHYDRVRQVFEKGEEKTDVLVDRPKMRVPMSIGNGKEKASAEPVAGEDDDFVLRTENLSLVERPNGVSKGKGKAKAMPEPDTDESMGFGSASEGDEFLYSP